MRKVWVLHPLGYGAGDVEVFASLEAAKAWVEETHPSVVWYEETRGHRGEVESRKKYEQVTPWIQAQTLQGAGA